MLQRVAADEAEWILCGRCRMPVYGRRWRRNLLVCPECSWHDHVSASERVHQLLDPGSVEKLEFDVVGADALDFVDTKQYSERLAEARAATGMREAVLAVRGCIAGRPLVVAAMDFRFLGGSMGTAVGETITLAAETALAQALPLLIVTASGGARMQEGALSLMQMAKTSAALGRLDEAGLLTVSLVTDPTFGGVAASFATLTDVIIAEPGARLGFAGRRVIEQTIRQQLPAQFQTAEFLLERGFVDRIVPRDRLRGELGRLLRLVIRDTHRPEETLGEDELVHEHGRLPERDAWHQVKLARDLSRPTTMDYLATVFDDFQELRGDRVSGDCPAIVAGTGLLDGRPVAVIGQQKGHSPAELIQHNFGMPQPAGYRKAARIMRLAAKLGLPVITLVDTPGAYPGAEAEAQGQSFAIAENLKLMARLPVPIVTVINGEGGSGGALALAVANRALIWTSGVYSVISPEGCASILWQDTDAAPAAANALRLTARDLLELGVVEGVLPEPDGGVGADPALAADRLRRVLSATVAELGDLDGVQLVRDRHARFRRFGVVPGMVSGPATVRTDAL